MDSFDPVAYLEAPAAQQVKPGLDRVRALLARMGDPQAGLRFVHVAGTNGKGSICAYLAAILRAAGLKVGLFASPALDGVAGTIMVDGAPISDEELAACTLAVRDAAQQVEAETGDAPTSFELTVAAALQHFARARCDICVVEAGMGGRLDATNVIMAEVCAIARIGLDHMAFLGDTLAQIAAEKAGIVKPGARVVTWPQEQEARRVIEDVCEARGCPLTMPDFQRLAVGLPDVAAGERAFSYKGQDMTTRMLGAYQPENASVAIEAAFALRRCGWDVPDRAIREGVATASIPARFEVLRQAPLCIVDGAHNPQGAVALAESLDQVARAQGAASLRARIVMGVLADKDYEAMIAPLVPHASSFVAYAPDNPRALPAADLARAIRRQAAEGTPVDQAPDAEAAAALALKGLSCDGCVVACGSLYSAAALRKAILSA